MEVIKYMSDFQHHKEDSAIIRTRLRNRVLGGGGVLLDSMTADELSVAQEMIFKDEAEIVSSACKPFLTAKLNRIIIA